MPLIINLSCLSLLLSLLLLGCSDPVSEIEQAKPSVPVTLQAPTYVGGQQCVDCHEAQFHLWRDSHHDLAMQSVNEKTVQGDFDNSSFEYFGITSKFYKKEQQFFVVTDGPDGTLTEYPIAYVFGVYPLQQYLIAL